MVPNARISILKNMPYILPVFDYCIEFLLTHRGNLHVDKFILAFDARIYCCIV